MNRSSTPRWRNLRLGVFFVLGLFLLLATLFVVGTNQHLFRRMADYRMLLGNAQGLSRGATVALSGLEVGRITDIRFIEHEGEPMVEIRLAVERRHRRMITGSSVATLRTVGVLGDRFIDISLGRAAEPALAEGALLPVRGTTDWTVTFERGVRALDDFIVLVKEASDVVKKVNEGEGTLGMLVGDAETRDRLRALAGNAAAVAGALRTEEGTLGRLINRPETWERMNGALTRLEEIGREAREGNGLLPRLLGDPAFAARVDSLIADSEGLVAAIGSQGTTGRLISDATLYEDLRSAIEELRALVTDMKENPGRYVRVSIF